MDDAAADAWAVLVAALRGAGRKAPVDDSWIAAGTMPIVAPASAARSQA